MKKRPLEKFVNDQLSLWPLACDNFRALKGVQSRIIDMDGLPVRIQFNPARIVSTSADVRESAVKGRKCFLCRENRPQAQMHIRFEGRKSKKYDVLVNPYPIFQGHLVIASDRHVPQSIWKRYVDMLDMAKAFQGYTVFYNGPECGASAPDHFHFQAALRGQMPLECDIDSMLDTVKGMPADSVRSGLVPGCTLDYLTSVQDAELFHYLKFIPGVFVIRAATSKSAAKMFYRLLDCAPSGQGTKEPMFNLLSWYSQGEYRSVVIFRGAHRPRRYFSEGEERLMVSPGCADMAGTVITPLQQDFEKMTPGLLAEIYADVCVSVETEKGILWRLVRKQQQLSVGIMSAKEIEFEILSDGAGPRSAVYKEGKIEYGGALYDELFFEALTPSMMFAEPSFILYGVTIGVDFHWERKEDQKFAGALKIVVDKDRLRAINIIGIEDYLLSVISSEMKSSASEEFLKAHAVISRSWVLAQVEKRMRKQAGYCDSAAGFPEGVDNLPAMVSYLDSIKNGEAYTGPEGHAGTGRPRTIRHIRWYGHEDHKLFDVCADDHCQRYQGLTRAIGDTVRRAVDATWGQVLMYGGNICDARFSKCCGGVTERYSTCWEDMDYPYLQSISDAAADDTPPFCSTSDRKVLLQVLNDYDTETMDFYRWTAEYDRTGLSELISGRLGVEVGELLAVIPLERGASGRISLLEIIGTECDVIVGKELEIRRILSESHLKSSAFDVCYYDSVGMKIPAPAVEKAARQWIETGRRPELSFDRVVLKGKGWGHGVGLCQIGAAVMASGGYGYREILGHYYRGASVEDKEL